MMAIRPFGGSVGVLRAAALATLVFARTGAAHEHHLDEIPDGEAISLEPLVRPALEGA